MPSAEIALPDGTVISTDDPAVSRLLSDWLGLPATLYPRLPASNKQHYRRAIPGASAAGLLAKNLALSKVVNRLAQLGANGEQLRRDLGREQGEPMPDLTGMPGVFEFVSPPGTYFDAFPIHFITTATLAALRSRHPAGDWDERRFRANVIIQTDAQLTGFVETAWVGRTLRIGEAELECVLKTPRCSVVMQPQGELARDPHILRTIVRDAGQNVGLYARVRRAGRVQRGDAVELR